MHETRHDAVVLWALCALGGEATLGDLVAVTGLARSEIERTIERLIARGRGHARVLERGDLVFHLSGAPVDATDRGLAPGSAPRPRRRWALARVRRTIFDRKTLALIRTREGVLSLAELVEQTGLPLPRAEAEMRRLAETWGGESHVGLDGHTVFAFPDLMTSVHGQFVTREPRPAWVRDEDPMDHAGERSRRAWLGIGATLAGVLSLGSLPLLVGGSMAGAASLIVAGGGASLIALGAREVLRHHRRFRFRQPDTLRRYALGHVVETALAGKGVVSLDRTVGFIQARAGERPVSRRAVERALRDLAAEFDAPITAEGDDLFFGFRNVKRQFLASILVRRQLALGRRAEGETVFDTADSAALAAARDLLAFDRELGVRPGPAADLHPEDVAAAQPQSPATNSTSMDPSPFSPTSRARTHP